MLRLVLVAVITCASCAPAVAQELRRPNVLFLFADDQRPDAVGAFGNRHVTTPSIDRLAARGFAFRQAYCMGSRHGAVCAPSRAMLMSGRTLHRVRDDLDGVVTLPQALRDSGYATFATGKWHNGRSAFARSFAAGEAVYFGGMADHFAVRVVDHRDGEFGEPRTGSKHSSELFADAAIGFLESRAAGDDGAPFLCYVAFMAPHDPRDAPPEFRERALADRPPLPLNFRPQHGWNIGEDTLLVRDEQLAAWPRDPEVVRDQLAEYYALIEHLDVQVGRVLAALDRLGLADDTIVVYAADHGLAVGSHGLLGKQNLYEHSMGLPMIVAGPGIAPGSSDALVYLLDLFPTVCGWCGTSVPDGVEGQDLGPLVRGEPADVRDTLFTLYRDNQRAIRDERFKLIRFTRTGKTLLFDLRDDPHEIRDLARDPGHAATVDRLIRELEAWQQRAGDLQELVPTEPLAETVDLAGHARKPDRWQPDWIRAKYFGEGGEQRRP